MKVNWWTRSVEYIFCEMKTYDDMKLNKFDVNNEYFYVKLNTWYLFVLLIKSTYSF